MLHPHGGPRADAVDVAFESVHGGGGASDHEERVVGGEGHVGNGGQGRIEDGDTGEESEGSVGEADGIIELA